MYKVFLIMLLAHLGAASDQENIGCPNQYQHCDNKSQCIWKDRFCDGYFKDCYDGSDEGERCKERQCLYQHARSHKCANQIQCVDIGDICDGRPRCKDRSDEQGCENHQCGILGAQTCANQRQCVWAEEFCDGLSNCFDGSDEKDCDKHQCPPDMQKCKDQRQCVYKTQICDGRVECRDESDEDGCETLQTKMSLSLIGGTYQNEGTVRVEYSGYSGVICDDDWGIEDANVVCRMLGFSRALFAVTDNHYGYRGNANDFLFDEFQCKGKESSLLECPHRDHRQHDCGVGETAGVVCAVVCESGFHTCKNQRQCIKNIQVCNLKFDCEDWSDEQGCEKHQCPPDMQKCKDQRQCVYETQICDGHVQCRDESDEDGCENHPCLDGFQKCADQAQCVSKLDLCNGKVDCRDLSDEGRRCERRHCHQDKHKCADQRKCVQVGEVCDDKVDCDDESDERGCENHQCGVLGATTCADHRACVWDEWICNGRNDCLDASDEVGCEKHQCPPDMQKCKDQRQCVYETQICDGHVECSDESDEEGCGTLQTNMSLRLVGGNSINKGTVRVEYSGYSGVICDDKWHIKDANVVCRMLGFSRALKAARENEYSYRGNTDDILFDDFQCFGNESSLLDCPHSGFRESDCDVAETAGVVCQEIQCDHNHEQCDDKRQCILKYSFCDGKADCVDESDEGQRCENYQCHQNHQKCANKLGCVHNLNICDGVFHCRDTSDEQGCENHRCSVLEAPVCANKYQCVMEAEICDGMYDCYDTKDEQGCVGYKCRPGMQKCADLSQCVDVTWICDGDDDCVDQSDERGCELGTQRTNMSLSLVGGSSQNEGTVRVEYSGRSGVVCDHEWDIGDANVVCRMLGFSRAQSAVTENQYGYIGKTEDILFDDFLCTGRESSLLECPHNGFGKHNCSVGEIAGAVCAVETLQCQPNYKKCANQSQCVDGWFFCNGVDNECDDGSDEMGCDQCTAGFTPGEDRCYRYINRKKTWSAADNYCRRLDAHLAEPRTQWQIDFLMHLSLQKRKDVWLGATDLAVEGEWVWAYSQAAVDEPKYWNPSQPNDTSYDDEWDCLEINNYKAKTWWNDIPCHHRNVFVCEKEMARAKKATEPTAAPQPIEYRVFTDKLSYSNATKSCEVLGGMLAMPKTSSMYEDIVQAFNSTPGATFNTWIGLKRDGDGWSFEDGTPQENFSYWGTEQPNNWRGDQDCVQLRILNEDDPASSTNFNGWHDVKCLEEVQYVCEFKITATGKTAAPQQNNSIIDHLLESRADHPHMYAPPAPASTHGPVVVGVTMSLINILKSQTETGEVDLLASITLKWNDPSLSWDPELYGNVTSQTLPTDAIWTPDIVRDSLTKASEFPAPDTVRVSHDGQVTNVLDERMRILCLFQEDGKCGTCPLALSSWTQDANALDLRADSPNIDVSRYYAGSNFLVEGSNVTRREVGQGEGIDVTRREVNQGPETRVELEMSFRFCKK